MLGDACPTTPIESYKQCQCKLNDNCVDLLYFYHSDHLGSSTYLTDINGEPYQFMLYLPFGESMVEQNVASYSTPYQYTGQELDSETGYYYYGARYYDASIGVFLSVDPLADQFTGWSPFNYTFNNPINFTDPSGMAPECDDCPIKYTGPSASITAQRGGGIVRDNTRIAPLSLPSRVNDIRGENADSYWKLKGGATGTQYATNNEVYSSLANTNSPKEFSMYRGKYGMEHAHGLFQHGIKQAISDGYQPFYTGLAILAAIETGGAAFNIYRALSATRPMIHYTSAAGYRGIMSSKSLNPSIGLKNARHGNGHYFTDIMPGSMTRGQVSYRLYGVPGKRTSLTHYIKVETTGLNLIKNKAHNYLNPSNGALDLTRRILGGGKTGY